MLHERVILLHVMTLDQPKADRKEMLEHQEIGEGLHRVTLKFGFAETPDVPAALKSRLPESVRFQPGKATYFLGSETYGVGKKATFIDRIRLSLFRDHGAQRLARYRLLPATSGASGRVGRADHLVNLACFGAFSFWDCPDRAD